jgi:hypothetical protein
MISLDQPLYHRSPAAAFLSDIQDNILKSHCRDHAHHVFVRFGPDVNAVRAWPSMFTTSHVTSMAKGAQHDQSTRSLRWVGVTGPSAGLPKSWACTATPWPDICIVTSKQHDPQSKAIGPEPGRCLRSVCFVDRLERADDFWPLRGFLACDSQPAQSLKLRRQPALIGSALDFTGESHDDRAGLVNCSGKVGRCAGVVANPSGALNPSSLVSGMDGPHSVLAGSFVVFKREGK